MEKRQAVEFLEYLRQDRNLERTIYGDALKIAIESLKAQLFSESTTSDLISRQAAIDEINHICPVDTEYDCTLLDRVDVRCVLSDLPTIQHEPAIPLSWIEKHIEWHKSLDNEFANLAAAHISVMVKKWRDEQNETD